MNQTNKPKLGPATMGTLVTSRATETVASYTQHLDQKVSEQGEIPQELADLWGAPALTGNNYWILENQVGDPWLRIIEDLECGDITPLKHTGWMALEVCVADTDALGEKLVDSPFEIIGPPADLDVSDKIRAMQVIGLAGEVLYLTEIKGDVPPFELPRARCSVDRLFIPVMCCHDRTATLAVYESLACHQGMSFDTKITVINRAYGYPVDDRHPVATIQLIGNSLIEMDQISASEPPPTIPGHLPAGIAMISFMVEDIDPEYNILESTSLPYAGNKAACIRGNANEIIELIALS
jgi:hypothetical protein